MKVTSGSLMTGYGVYFPLDGWLTAVMGDFRLNYDIFNTQLEADTYLMLEGSQRGFHGEGFSGVKLLEFIVKEINSSCRQLLFHTIENFNKGQQETSVWY